MTQTCRRGKLYTSSTTTCPIEYCKLREPGKAQPKPENALSPDFVQNIKCQIRSNLTNPLPNPDLIGMGWGRSLFKPEPLPSLDCM